MGSTTASKGAEVGGVRTGLEPLVAHFTNSTQAVAAEYPGKVIEITDQTYTVTYKTSEGNVERIYRLGKYFGRHEGGTYPQELIPNLKVGESFKKGDILTYNKAHFEPDLVNPKQVNWKPGPVVSVYFLEGNDTIEDSSAIDKVTSGLISTDTTKVKCVFIRFDEAVHNLVKVGDEVDPETILCTIEDPLTAGVQGVFSDEAKRTLDAIADASPKAGLSGRIDKIEVFYNGDIDEASPTVLNVIKADNKLRKREATVSPETIAPNGQVDSSLRLDGRSVELNTLVIRIYITHTNDAIGGDKCVIANQMKSVFRRRMVGNNHTEDGNPINIIFGRKSVDERIVYSVYQVGVGNTWGRLMADAARKLVAGG